MPHQARKKNNSLSEMSKVRDSTYLMSHRFTDTGSCCLHSLAEKPYGGVDGAADAKVTLLNK